MNNDDSIPDAVTASDVDRYVAFADEFRAQLYGSDVVVWIDRVDQELDQLRRILHHVATGNRQEDIEQALRITGGLREYWWKGDKLQEGRDWLLRLLTLSQGAPRTQVRAQALDDAAVLAFYQEDYEDAISLLWQSIAIRRELDEGEPAVYSLLHLASIYRVGKHDSAAARAANEDALTIAQQHGIDHGIGYALSALGRVAIDAGDWVLAHSRLTESLRVLQQVEDSWALTIVLRHCALLAAATDAPKRALRLAAASTALQEGLGMTTVAADQEMAEAILARAWAALPPIEADATWQEGCSMSLEEALTCAFQKPDDGPELG